jgi:tetratricopeptide (TPR) repeat protein
MFVLNSDDFVGCAIRKIGPIAQTRQPSMRISFSPDRSLLLALLLASISLNLGQCMAQDWPNVISKLERGGQQRRKQQLPTAYNNYAIALSEQGDWKKAEAQLEKAIALNGTNQQFKKNLAAIYIEHAMSLRKQRQANGLNMHRTARRLAEKALIHDRNLAEAHVLIGDIAYDNQHLRQARAAWTKARKLKPDLQAIETRIAKLNTEFAIEKNFDRETKGYFDIRYQNGIKSSTAVQFQQWLSKARRDVGNDFKYWPRHKIVVLVYSPEAFKRIRSGPDWVAGIYDGKIRVPLPNTGSGKEEVKPTLVHEYAHAVVHDLGGGRCPVWLNEGLAEFQEAKVRQPALDRLRTAVRLKQLIPINQLDDAFQSSDLAVASLAYQEAYSIVQYVAQSQGFFRFGRILKLVASGVSVDVAIEKELRLTTAQLERNWVRWLPDIVR